MGELVGAMKWGQGLHTPIEIDWDPAHGLATIIQGNHRLLAAKELGFPFVPATIGQMYGDLGRYLAYARAAETKPSHHVYGSIKVGSAPEALIQKLLSLSTQAHPETGGLYHFRKDVNVTPADWDALVNSLGLKNVRVAPGTTIAQVREMPPFKRGK
jgi:hypothetical protein